MSVPAIQSRDTPRTPQVRGTRRQRTRFAIALSLIVLVPLLRLHAAGVPAAAVSPPRLAATAWITIGWPIAALIVIGGWLMTERCQSRKRRVRFADRGSPQRGTQNEPFHHRASRGCAAGGLLSAVAAPGHRRYREATGQCQRDRDVHDLRSGDARHRKWAAGEDQDHGRLLPPPAEVSAGFRTVLPLPATTCRRRPCWA